MYNNLHLINHNIQTNINFSTESQTDKYDNGMVSMFHGRHNWCTI